jgi:hypothetical protein
MRQASGNIFDHARRVAVALLIAATAAAVAGSLLDWVTITNRPQLAPDTDFEQEQSLERPRASPSYTGIEARDGWIIIGGAAVLAMGTVGLALRARRGYARLAFVAAIVIGAIAFADYRAVGDLSSGISERMEIVGDPDPAIGILLVVVAGIAGLIGAVLGLVATPTRTR